MTHVPAAISPFSGIPSLQDFTVVQIEIWLLVLIRVSVMVFLLPLLITEEIPARFKAAFSFFLSVILFPTLPATAVAIPDSVPAYIFLALREIYIGAVIGFAGTFVFAGLRFAGSWIDTETGFSMMQIINPVAQEEDTPMGHLLFLLFIILLLGTGGYAFYLQAIAQSFQMIPLTMAQAASGPMVAVFAQMSADCFLLGVRIAAPVVATLFVSSIALALIARIMPQMNVWMVGMPMKFAVGMLTLSFALPMLWQTFAKGQDGIQGYVVALMRLMGS